MSSMAWRPPRYTGGIGRRADRARDRVLRRVVQYECCRPGHPRWLSRRIRGGGLRLAPPEAALCCRDTARCIATDPSEQPFKISDVTAVAGRGYPSASEALTCAATLEHGGHPSG